MAEPRDEAMQSLYELEQRRPEQLEQRLAGKAQRIVSGVIEHERELINHIDSFSNNWKFDRMSAVDRAILKIGMYEIIHTEVHTGVIMAEAVRLARKFSTAKSSGFVNGLLGQAARTLREE